MNARNLRNWLAKSVIAGIVLAMTGRLSPGSSSVETFQFQQSPFPRVATVGGQHLRIRLSEIRGSRTLREFAEEVGIRADEISRIERGETHQVRWETLLRIFIAGRINIGDLFEMDTIPPQQGEPSWAAPLRALRAGTVKAGLPSRDLSALDLPGSETYAVENELDNASSHFEEEDDLSRVRRGPFRPIAR